MKTDDDLRDILNKQIKEIGSIRKWAEAHGVGKSLVGRSLRVTEPFPKGVGEAMGYVKTRVWVKKTKL